MASGYLVYLQGDGLGESSISAFLGNDPEYFCMTGHPSALLTSRFFASREDFEAVILSATKACPERSEGNLLFSEGLTAEADASLLSA